MSYAPGIQYIGGQLLGQGIAQAGQALTSGLDRYAARKDATEQLRAQLAGPQVSGLATYAEAPGAATTPNGLADSMGTPEGPNEGTGEGNATEAEKKVHKLTKALRDIGEHGYGYSRPVVDSMGYNELTGLVRREEKLREQRQDALVKARLIQEAQHQQAQEDLALKQFGLAQDADKRAAELAAVMLPYHKLQTAGLMQAQQENEAIGNALGAFSRGGTNVSPVSYSDWAARAGVQLGGTPPPVGSTPFTYEDRVNRALQTPGLGGRGAVQLLGTLEKFAPKEPDELKRLQAVKLGLEIEGMRNPDKSFGIVDLEKATGDPGLRGRYGVLKTGAVERVGGYNLPEGLPSVPGHTPVPDGKGGIVWLKVPEESDLTDMSKPPTTPAPPGYSWVADKGRWTQKPIPKAAVLQGLMGITNAPAATTSPQNSTTSGKYKVSW